MSAGGSSQTALAPRAARSRRIVERQLLADQVVSRLAERIAIPARPVEPPVFPVVDSHPDRPVGPDELGLDANAVPLELVDRDLASHFGADRRTVAEDLQLLHAERKHDVPFGEIIEAPAPSNWVKLSMTTRSVWNVVACPALTSGSRGSTCKRPSIPLSERLPMWAMAWKSGPWNSHCSA